MDIIVIGGQPNEDLVRYLTYYFEMGLNNSLKSLIDKKSHNNVDPERKEDFTYLCFPERTYNEQIIPEHPSELFERMIKVTNDCIKNNKSLYILTFSDHVLNGVRVAIKENKKEVIAECHQLHDGGEVSICPINKEGDMSIWEKDIFDVYDSSLDRLLFNS